jgi:V/A-type H+-transporting ATPase subunit D
VNLNIPATKTNLIKFKKTLQLTKEGHDLLDEKRRILMAELTSILYSMDKMQRDVDAALVDAYKSVDRAVVTTGRKKLEELSFAIDIRTDLSLSQRRVMGVSVPVVDIKIKENPPYYSPYEVSFYVDDTILKFKELLKMLAQLAEKKMALMRIARETQKTIRKVNALEKVHLPYYRNTVKVISDKLDEESRESFSMSKLIKQKLRNR